MNNNEHPTDLTAQGILPSVRDIVNRLEPGKHYLIESNASGDTLYDSENPSDKDYQLDAVLYIKVKPIFKQVSPLTTHIELVIILVLADFKFD